MMDEHFDLLCVETVLSPHELLPNEILSEIFILLALDFGPVEIPLPRHIAPPPQLVLLRVCSRWRTVALCTPKLWNNAYLPSSVIRYGPSVQLVQQWILRAGETPIELSLSSHFRTPSSVLQEIFSQIKVKKLELELTQHQVVELCRLPDTVLPDLEELSLWLPLDHYECSFDKPFFTRLRSVVFYDGNFSLRRPHVDRDVQLGQISLPWHHLRCLQFRLGLNCTFRPTVINLLRQMPKLRQLNVSIEAFPYPLQPLCLPNLRDLTLEVAGDIEESNEVIRSLICPALTRFVLDSHCSFETYDIIKQQYHFKGLEEFKLSTRNGWTDLPASLFLMDAPMLRALTLPSEVIMDTEAIIGLSNGTLGRFLRMLHIECLCNVTEIVEMVEKRKKLVDRLIEDGCSWRDEVTVLRNIVICHRGLDFKRSDERVIALEEAGIAITNLCS